MQAVGEGGERVWLVESLAGATLVSVLDRVLGVFRLSRARIAGFSLALHAHRMWEQNGTDRADNGAVHGKGVCAEYGQYAGEYPGRPSTSRRAGWAKSGQAAPARPTRPQAPRRQAPAMLVANNVQWP